MENKSHLPPYGHQADALQWLREKEDPTYAGLFMDPGTGKTRVTINEIERLYMEGKINGALILAPKGMYYQWMEQLMEWGTPKLLSKEINPYLWTAKQTKGEKQSQADALEPEDNWLDIVVMNIEGYSTKRAVQYATKFINNHKCYMCIDESLTIKGYKSKRTRSAIATGGRAEYRRILNGTPISNSPMDAFSQMKFLHESILGSSFFAFRARYANLEDQFVGAGRSIKVITGYKRQNELKRKLDNHCFRVRIGDCVDLPPKIYEQVHMEMGAEQARIYEEMRELSIAELEEEEVVTATIALTKLMKLRQISSGFITTESGLVKPILDSPRLHSMLDAIEFIPGKMIIWAVYRQNVEDIIRCLNKVHGEDSNVAYYGGMGKQLEANKKIFMEDDKCRFFVGTPQTGKFGLNLTVANTMLYFNNDFSLEVRDQSEARQHRIGQTKTCLYIDMIMRGTIDKQIIDSLRNKQKMASVITGDTWKEWFYE